MKSEKQIQTEADYAYWKTLADAVGWRVFGFSGRYHASYVKDDENEVASLAGWMRDDIMNVIKLREL